MLILVRHGPVRVDPFVSVADWTLDEAATPSVTSLRQHPLLKQPCVVASSPEPKAFHTAELLFPNAPVLVEAAFGELDRRAAGWLPDEAAYANLVRCIFANPHQAVADCETAYAATTRFAAGVEKLRESVGVESLVVVSHGLALTAFLAMVLGLQKPDIMAWRALRFPDMAAVDLEERRLVMPFGSFDNQQC